MNEPDFPNNPATDTPPQARTGGRLQVLTAGYSSLDRLFRVSHQPAAGATALIEAGDDTLYRGGCAFNIAAGLRRLGIQTGVLGWLGSDPAGQDYRSFLKEAGVDVTGLVQTYGPSARSFIYYAPSGSSQCYFQPGVSGEPGDLERQLPLVGRADWLILTAGYPWQTAALLDEAARQAVPVVWSVKADKKSYPPELIDRLVRGSRILFLNRDELDFIGQHSTFDTPEKLIEAGADLVILTLGAAGSRVYGRGAEAVEIPARPVARVVDPTGSGDALIAAFMAALVRGKNVVEAALAGSGNAAAVLEQFGSQTGLCDWEELTWRLR